MWGDVDALILFSYFLLTHIQMAAFLVPWLRLDTLRQVNNIYIEKTEHLLDLFEINSIHEGSKKFDHVWRVVLLFTILALVASIVSFALSAKRLYKKAAALAFAYLVFNVIAIGTYAIEIPEHIELQSSVSEVQDLTYVKRHDVTQVLHAGPALEIVGIFVACVLIVVTLMIN